MLNLAIDAAKQGSALANSYFKKQLKVLYKTDNSPVTEADNNTEKLIQKIISKKFPSHGFIGEENGKTQGKSQFEWVVDPIDGTKAFIRGIPTWGTLVALLKNGKPIIGVYASPASNELFWSEKGKGTFLNGKRTYVSKIKDLNKTYIVYGAIHKFKEFGKLNGLTKLSEITSGKRGSSDSDGFGLLLKSQVDAVLQCSPKIHDIAAHAILVEEAGGKFTDFEGKFSITSGNAVATNGLIHNQVLKILNS